MSKILNIEGLSIGYSTKKKQIVVAENINVKVEKSKLVCLLGKNGIGKSTLLRTIAKIQPTLIGKIQIENKNIESYNSVGLSKKVSIVLTERIPPNNLTVYELIALGRQVYTNWIGKLTETDKQIIKKAIEKTKINAIENKKVDELSDGQYQKMMIARALAQDTPIILLDEPTAHLDINNKVAIFRLLKDIVTTSKKSKLIIISSHELQLAIQTADDLWLMSENEFVCGDKNELIEKDKLQEIFETELVSFDKDTKQFLFH